MAATLLYTAMAACLLASVTNLIATDGAEAAMVGASPFATGPTEAPTGITIALVADRASCDATSGAEQLLTSVTLGETGITNQMTTAIQHNLGHFLLANMTMRAV